MSSHDRPLSPHLQIYRPQLTSLLSVTHRGTGVMNAIGTLLLAYWLISLAQGPESYAGAKVFFAHWLVKLALFGWTFSVFYHLCNGVRHLFWDAGLGYDIPTLYKSGFAVLAVASVLTILTWLAI